MATLVQWFLSRNHRKAWERKELHKNAHEISKCRKKNLKLSAQKRFCFDNATWRFRQRAPRSLFFSNKPLYLFCGTVLKVIHLVPDNQTTSRTIGLHRSRNRIQETSPAAFHRPSTGQSLEIVEGE